MATPLVADVCDTARWVAVYRDWESARPDALFHDPFAGRLAGERGRAIAAKAPRQSSWPLVTRTKVIDDLVLTSVAQGCDLVINLAAGLDTRPYRLALPASLRWIEADLPAIVDEKARLLAQEHPVCRLERERVDLADAQARAAFLDRAVRGAARALVITEGLVVYLEAGVVQALGRDLASRPGIRWWMLDVVSPAVLLFLSKGVRGRFANAPFRFAPPDGVAFFETLGWQAREIRSLFREAVRIHRAPLLLRPFALFPDPNPRRPGINRWSAVVRLQRTEETPREKTPA